MNIVILGHVCIDTNISEQASYIAAGGPAMFMQKIFHQLPGTQVTIIAPYGADFLEQANNEELYPTKPIGKKTLTYENTTKAGIRVQKAHHRQVANPLPVDTKMIELIAAAEIIFIAPLLPNFSPIYLKQILTYAQPTALKVLLPQGYYRDFDLADTVLVRSFLEAAQILPLIDLVIVSEQDHVDMVEQTNKWANQFKILAVTTLGKKGAVAVTATEKILLPASVVPEQEIVDSVGSGDIFSAGFAYRYHQTQNIKEAGRFANALARQCLFFTPNEIKIDYSALLT